MRYKTIMYCLIIITMLLLVSCKQDKTVNKSSDYTYDPKDIKNSHSDKKDYPDSTESKHNKKSSIIPNDNNCDKDKNYFESKEQYTKDSSDEENKIAENKKSITNLPIEKDKDVGWKDWK